MTTLELRKAAATAKDALVAAGQILKNGFSRRNRISFKSLTNPVTEIDVRSEKAIISLIRRRFPSHGFLAEESEFQREKDGRKSIPSEYRWVIDPLDGTANFLHRIPIACVSIALEHKGTVLTGGIMDPFRDELFLATRQQGATLNGKRIRVSPEHRLHRSMLFTGFPYDNPTHAKEYLRMFEPLMKLTMGVRRFGAAAIDLAWVACGRAEGFWEYKLKPWDVAAGVLLVEEAGGKVSDFSGHSLRIDQPVRTLATNGRVHKPLLSLFRKKL